MNWTTTALRRLLYQRSLRGKLFVLLVLSMGVSLLLSGLLLGYAAQRFHEADTNRVFDELRQKMAEAVASRHAVSGRIASTLATDGSLAVRLEAIAALQADRTGDRNDTAAHQRALTLRLARTGPSVSALVIAYDRYGEPLSYFDARGDVQAIGSFPFDSVSDSQPLEIKRSSTSAAKNPSRVRRADVKLTTSDEASIWRLIDSTPMMMSITPVLANTAHGWSKVGYVGVFVAPLSGDLRALLDNRHISVDLYLPGSKSSGSARLPIDELVFRGAPSLTQAAPSAGSLQAGRFETSEHYVQALRLPVDSGRSPHLLLLLDKSVQRQKIYLTLGGVLLVVLLSGCLAMPLALNWARAHILNPVQSLEGAIAAVDTGGSIEPASASSGGNDDLGGVRNKLDELAAALRRRKQESDLWLAVFDKTNEAIFIADTDGKVLFVNRALSEVTGQQSADVIGKVPRFMQRGGAADGFPANIVKALKSNGKWAGEVWDARPDGTAYPQWVTLTAIEDARSVVTHYVGIFNDISERKAQEERIHYLATHDALTGLPNRTLLMDRLKVAIAHAQRDSHQAALLFIDLDRFKNINDTLGHYTGDALLQAVAERLKRAVRASDTVCRLGGDEFIVLLHKTHHVLDAEVVAEHILANLAPVVRVGNHDLSITPSIGISIFPSDATSADELIRTADIAMYYAKAQGRNNFQSFKASMNQSTAEHMSLEYSLRQAVDRDEFRLYYQPQIDVASNTLVAVEALMRWTSSDFGVVPPNKFIPIAEESGLILRIGDWVTREACRQRAEWTRSGIGHFPISVNVSALQFRQPDFIPRVRECLRLFGLRADELELELTESIVMQESQAATHAMNSLKELGVRLAIDDFGTGYSSLSYLKHLPIDKLKIDASFVRDIETDEANCAIAEAIISLGRALGMSLVAEGVENVAALTVLSELGCGVAQGYYYCRPVPADEFVAWYAAFQEGTARLADVA